MDDVIDRALLELRALLEATNGAWVQLIYLCQRVIRQRGVGLPLIEYRILGR